MTLPRRNLNFTLAVVFAVGAALITGCGAQAPLSDRPNWSLSEGQTTKSASSKKTYGDWNGAGAPKPLMYEKNELPSAAEDQDRGPSAAAR